MKRKLLTCLGLSLLLMWSTGWADDTTAAQPFQVSKMGDKYEQEAKKPNFLYMSADAVIARPILFATTVVGTGLFLVTLPFTAASNSVGEAGRTLVTTPAKATFQRCLGCGFNDNDDDSSK